MANSFNLTPQFARSWLARWRDRRAIQKALAEFDRGGADVRRMAADLGCSTADLRDIVAAGPSRLRLLTRMLQAHGLARAAIAKTNPGLLRDIEASCSRCRSAARCERELEAGSAVAHAGKFCMNAETMADLRAEERERFGYARYGKLRNAPSA